MVVTLAYPLSPVLTVLSHQVWWPMVTIHVVTMDTLSVSMWYFATVGYWRQEGRVKSGCYISLLPCDLEAQEALPAVA